MQVRYIHVELLGTSAPEQHKTKRSLEVGDKVTFSCHLSGGVDKCWKKILKSDPTILSKNFFISRVAIFMLG